MHKKPKEKRGGIGMRRHLPVRAINYLKHISKRKNGAAS